MCGSLQNLKDLFQKVFSVQQFDLNKVELNKERTDMKKLVEETFNEFQPVMAESALDFSLEEGSKKAVFANVDPSQIRQVLSNLLDNARKFTPRGGKVILRIGTAGKKVTVEVQDSGEGVPRERRKKIFEKYSTNHNSQGIGLGLYICKKIIDLHTGQIRVRDSKLGGASFCISLRKAR